MLNQEPTRYLIIVLGVAIAALAVVASPAAARDAPDFELTIIPSLPTPVGELRDVVAWDINDGGQVAGTASDNSKGVQAAIRFTVGRGIEDLDPDGEYSSWGWAISRAGTVLGFVDVFDQLFGDPFLHRDGADFDFLETGEPDAVRDGGFIPGVSTREALPDSESVFGAALMEDSAGQLQVRPWVYTADKGWIDLSGLHPRFADEQTFGAHANNAGYQVFVITGQPRPGEKPPTGSQEYFVRTPRGRVHEVISPGRPVTPGSRPNGRGRMAGLYLTVDEAHSRAYVWTKKRGLIDIHPEGYRQSFARGVNRKGVAFGVLHAKKKSSDVFVHTDTKGVEVVVSKSDLVELAKGRRGRFGGVDAPDMNNRQEIVGCVQMSGGPNFAFYYSPKHGLFGIASVLAELDPSYVEDECSSPYINNKSQILIEVRNSERSTAAILSVVDAN